MFYDLKYCNHELHTICVSISVNDCYKIPESAIKKALMIAMNYLMENMETEDQESAD
jgi:hypothetical protein